MSQELKFRKCSNTPCDALIAFQKKKEGGWAVFERDALGQLQPHKCKFYKPKQDQQGAAALENQRIKETVSVVLNAPTATTTTTNDAATEISQIRAQLLLLSDRLQKLQQRL